MSNYKVTFRPGEENNNWNLAFELIKPKSKVLDIGCSNGNFGEALVRLKQCTVEGVEPDKEDAELARHNLSKVYNCSIEEAVQQFKPGTKYDHIVFLDVIEHLYNPVSVLDMLKPYLKEGGSIVFSIPNMGHQSVRIMLLQGDFDYGQTGILDNTHLHFYTEREINRVFNTAGFVLKDLKGVSVIYNDELLKKELKKIGIDTPDKALVGVLNSNNAHIYQYVGAAVVSSNPVYKKIERKFQSPEAKAVINREVEKKIKRLEQIVQKYEREKKEFEKTKADINSLLNSESYRIGNLLVRVPGKAKAIVSARNSRQKDKK